MIDNSREKANILNSYFASVYTKEPLDEIPKLTPRQAPKKSKTSITVEMVKRLIHDLNVYKSPGPELCSILTKGSTCRKNKKMSSRADQDKSVEKKFSVLAQIFTRLWSIYELHNYIILIIILDSII